MQEACRLVTASVDNSDRWFKTVMWPINHFHSAGTLPLRDALIKKPGLRTEVVQMLALWRFKVLQELLCELNHPWLLSNPSHSQWQTQY